MHDCVDPSRKLTDPLCHMAYQRIHVQLFGTVMLALSSYKNHHKLKKLFTVKSENPFESILSAENNWEYFESKNKLFHLFPAKTFVTYSNVNT